MSFTVYRSSAGSGKTYTLVKEYLGIVLKDPAAFRSILAITFTNKAANEMRDRILRGLIEISDPSGHGETNAVKHMLPELVKTCGLEQGVIIKNAGIVLTQILHNYQDFSVSTIDSFIHRIIRTFAFDLHLPLNFEVEVDEGAMVSQAVDMLLSRVGVDEAPTKALSGFTEARISDEKSWNIEGALKTFSKRLLKDDIVNFLPALKSMDTFEILKVIKVLTAFRREFESELSKQAGQLISFWDAKGIDGKDLYFGKSGIYGYVDKLHKKNFKSYTPGSRVINTLGEDKWYADSLDAGKKTLIDSWKSEMVDMVGAITTYIDENRERYEFYNILKKNIFQLAVLNEILKVMDQIRENDGIIHISEFDKRISKVVNNEPIPFIYERLGEKYRHFLIDEFQDTSILEWQNILPLIENSLSEDHFNMVVGDAKQAIYRFKGGEVEQLVTLPEIFRKEQSPEMEARENMLKRNYNARKLNYNFRSREAIIKFNNDFYEFSAGLLPESLRLIYADSKQEMPVKNPGGEVHITFLDLEGKKEENEPAYLENILQKVNDLKEIKSYAYNDIAILCRSNAEASKIARNLLLNGVAVVSAESLLLSSSPEVNFLVSCLDYIANKDDKLAMAAILSYVAAEAEKHKLNEILQSCLLQPDDTSAEGGNTGLEEFFRIRKIAFNADALRQMGLYERLETLIRIFSLSTTPEPYIIFFLDAVYEYSMNKRFIPEDFTIFWKENNHRYSIVVPEGLDAVKVMTIHKAKGLEFPVVIYPFANDKVDVRREQKWVHIDDERIPGLKTALLPVLKNLENTRYADIYTKEWEKTQLDLLNIFYVATTRPTERLFIICDLPSESAGEIKDIPGLIRAFLEDRQLWDDQMTEYSLGDPEPLPLKTKKPASVAHPELFISGNWRKNILLSGHAAEYWDLDDDSRNLEWGNLVHRILSGINTVSDLGPAIVAEVNAGNIQAGKAQELKMLLEGILSQEEIKPFFDGNYQLKNEAGILRPGGGEYRPDRLMIKEKQTIVLDYKTGKKDSKHIRQLEQYAALLMEMGYTEVEKYLLYIEEAFILEKI